MVQENHPKICRKLAGDYREDLMNAALLCTDFANTGGKVQPNNILPHRNYFEISPEINNLEMLLPCRGILSKEQISSVAIFKICC